MAAACMPRPWALWVTLMVFNLIPTITIAAGTVHVVYGKDPEVNINFDEGGSHSYVIAIKGADSPDPPIGRVMDVVGANGTRYRCYLPQVQENDVLPDGTTPVTSAVDAGVMPPIKTAEELLDGMGEWCAYRVEDWWTYEVCYKKAIRQYHTEGGGNKVIDQYSLGNFSAAENLSGEVAVDGTVVQGAVKFVRHMYTGGEPCDLDGADGGERGVRARSAEVRYTCGSGKQTVLTEVREPKSCTYVMTVATPRLCKHPAFADAPVAASPIPCYPMEHISGEDMSCDAASLALENEKDDAS